MNKVIIVIGQSASGKTTYIRNNLLKEKELSFIDKPFKMTVADRKTLLLGHHKGEKRCEGSDELSMAILPQLIEFIKSHLDDYEVMIFDGDRINNEKFFRFISNLNIQTELVILSCSLETSLKRRQEAGSKPSEKFVKGTITKSYRMKKLGSRLGFEIKFVNTDNKKQTTLSDFIGG